MGIFLSKESRGKVRLLITPWQIFNRVPTTEITIVIDIKSRN